MECVCVHEHGTPPPVGPHPPGKKQQQHLHTFLILIASFRRSPSLPYLCVSKKGLLFIFVCFEKCSVYCVFSWMLNIQTCICLLTLKLKRFIWFFMKTLITIIYLSASSPCHPPQKKQSKRDQAAACLHQYSLS